MNSEAEQRTNTLSKSRKQESMIPSFGSASDHHKTNFYLKQPPQNPLLRDSDDSELSIFNAERYYSETQEFSNVFLKKLTPIAESLDLSPKRRSFRATQAVTSETSWNSRTGLLKNPPGSVSSHKKGRRLFCLTCPCSCKKSVDVEKDSPSAKSQDLVSALNSGGFSFPVIAPARDSLEGMPSPVVRRLRSPVDDDLASDASSDLFEIESFSAQWSGGNLQMRRSAEEELYPPSEASVEWSVTTADVDDGRLEPVAGEGRKKEVAGGGLLSCRSARAALAVVPNRRRFGPEVQRRTGASVFAVEPDRVVGLARLGTVSAVPDGSRSVRVSRLVQPIDARVC